MRSSNPRRTWRTWRSKYGPFARASTSVRATAGTIFPIRPSGSTRSASAWKKSAPPCGKTRRNWPRSCGTSRRKKNDWPFSRGSRPRRRSNWVVWRRHAVNDDAVKAGTPLLDMIDPAEVFVDAVISESDLKHIHPGDTAQVRIAGSKETRKAKVSQVVGRTLPWSDQLLAADAAPATKREIHVLLRFSKPPSKGENSTSPAIGLPAEVTSHFRAREVLTGHDE